MIRKYAILFPLLASLMIGQSCVKNEMNTPHDPDRMILKLDLEDHVYKVDQEWYRWDVEVANCEPRFYARYIYENRTVEISFCVSLGELLPYNFEFIDDFCTATTTVFSSIQEEGRTIVSIQLSDDFHTCLYEQSDWIQFEFDFFYK